MPKLETSLQMLSHQIRDKQIEPTAHSGISWLAQDASNRRYARIKKDKKTFLAMVLDTEDTSRLQNGNYDWITIQKDLIQENIHCPNTLATNPSDGIVFIEDLGNQSLEQYVKKKGFSLSLKRFRDAFRLIGKMQNIRFDVHQKSPWTQRFFDKEFLSKEMFFLKEHLLEKTLSIYLNKKQERQFLNDISFLCEKIAEQQTGFVHRDFHSRNIMIYKDSCWIIDFQDARIGPLAYDYISLCFDSYLNLDKKQRFYLLEEALITSSRALSTSRFNSLKASWPFVLLQRQLKALGSFGYLSTQKNKNFAHYIPKALNILQEKSIQELRGLEFINDELIHLMLDAWEKQ